MLWKATFFRKGLGIEEKTFHALDHIANFAKGLGDCVFYRCKSIREKPKKFVVEKTPYDRKND